MRTSLILVSFAAAAFLAACMSEQPSIAIPSKALRAPVFDAEFRRVWDDGAAEVSSYDTVCLRNGTPRKGTGTSVLRRQTWSEDDRVVNTDPSHPKTDLFAAMQMNWIEKYSDGPQICQEMTTSALALSSVNGRAAGTAAKIDFSGQTWNGQLFHQLLFDSTGIRSHQYSYFEGEGDEQSTLSYPVDGVAADALWLWARHMAAPALDPGGQRNVILLTALRSARESHRPLAWKRATLARAPSTQIQGGVSGETFTVRFEEGATQTFLVEAASPFQVLQWDSSDGEKAVFLSSTRQKFEEPDKTSRPAQRPGS